MKTTTLCFFLALFSLSIFSQPKVIAHRGYWQPEGAAKNSLKSLELAQELDVYASEFDVWITADDVLVINHDATIDDIQIEKVNFSDLKDVRLSNGEPLPTLEQFLIQGKKKPKVKLVLEVKPHKSKQRETLAVQKVVELVKKYEMEDQMEYIAFSLNICKEFKRLQPKAPNAYLTGTICPRRIKSLGLDGIDYSHKILSFKKSWVKKSHKRGLTVNVWTVNDKEKMQEMIDLGVDFITTDKPVECQQLIDAQK